MGVLSESVARSYWSAAFGNGFPMRVTELADDPSDTDRLRGVRFELGFAIDLRLPKFGGPILLPDAPLGVLGELDLLADF